MSNILQGAKPQNKNTMRNSSKQTSQIYQDNPFVPRETFTRSKFVNQLNNQQSDSDYTENSQKSEKVKLSQSKKLEEWNEVESYQEQVPLQFEQ